VGNGVAGPTVLQKLQEANARGPNGEELSLMPAEYVLAAVAAVAVLWAIIACIRCLRAFVRARWRAVPEIVALSTAEVAAKRRKALEQEDPNGVIARHAETVDGTSPRLFARRRLRVH